MPYYGLDWASRIVIAWAIFELGVRPRRAIVIFMVANVLSVALALVASPQMWGTVVGDTLFLLLHARNLRCGRIK
jgi:NADH:ubiquinone oxidoreductase subunit K